MTDHIAEAHVGKLAEMEKEIGLEWVGLPKDEVKPSRAMRRVQARQLKKMLRRPEAQTTMYHVIFDDQLTPYGKREIAARRKKNKASHKSRKINQRRAA